MEIQIQWFGMFWVGAVVLAFTAAVFLVRIARLLAKQGRPTGLFQVAAAIEAALLVLDTVVRFGLSSIRPEETVAVDWGLWAQNAWTLFRPLAHAVVLSLVAIGLLRLERDRPAV